MNPPAAGQAWRNALEHAIIGGACLSFFVGCPSKTTGGDKTLSPELKDGIVKVTDEACKDLGGRDDAFVMLLCTVGSETVRVLLPRREWAQIRARRIDSTTDVGPGK